MKININGNEVSITVKERYNKRANKKDTYALLQDIAILAYDVSKVYEEQGYRGLTSHAKRIHDDIHNFLDSEGYYDDVK